jgi:TRAP-type mannitol/chloroaromatic compound transport system permease small subunit
MISRLQAGLLIFIQHQNQLQQTLGKTIAWLSLVLVLLTFSTVVLRYGLSQSFTALDESLIYTHALLFMLGMSYTLQQNAHVRVDVFYERFSSRRRHAINLIGHGLCVIPTMVFIIWAGWSYVAASWTIWESSIDSAGLPFVYLLKTLIIIMPVLVILQSLSDLIESAFRLFAPDRIRILPDRLQPTSSQGV